MAGASQSPWHRPDTRGRFVVFMAPIVFVVEWLCAWSAVNDWIAAAFIAVVVTPISLGLLALFWRPPGGAAPDE
jgi:hypothetical protein